jgi:c-di-GMP-binding flagellar brake protein YcgR
MTASHEPERRRTPRVDLLAEFQGHLVALDEPVHVRQIGEGGMTVATAAPISPTLDHEFRFTLGDQAVHLRTRVVHGRVEVRDDTVTYLTGLEFLDVTPAVREVIAEFIRAERAR